MPDLRSRGLEIRGWKARLLRKLRRVHGQKQIQNRRAQVTSERIAGESRKAPVNPRDCLHLSPNESCAYCQWKIAKALYESTESDLDIAKSNLALVGNFRDQMSGEIVERRLEVLGLNEKIRGLEKLISSCRECSFALATSEKK